MRWLPLCLGILLILFGLLGQRLSQDVVTSFMQTDNAARIGSETPYELLPLQRKQQWEETRVLEMETLDDPTPLNTFQGARERRSQARLVIWAGFAITLLCLLCLHIPRRSSSG